MFDHAKNYSNFNAVDDAETNSILHVFFEMKFQLTIKICKSKVDHFVSFFLFTSTFQPSFHPFVVCPAVFTFSTRLINMTCCKIFDELDDNIWFVTVCSIFFSRSFYLSPFAQLL